jgi:hypothetical protein
MAVRREMEMGRETGGERERDKNSERREEETD